MSADAAIDPDLLAADLVHAWRDRTFVAAPTRTLPGFRAADALAVAERVRELRIAGGAVPVGYKVGFTNAAVRAQFDAAGPIAATVYDQTLRAAPRIDARLLLGPRIEPEVVVGIGADGAIAWAALGFEIVQSHIAGWEFGYLDAIADFGLHAALIVGERLALAGDEADRLASLRVELRRDGVCVERGASADVDGGAAGSVRWLSEHLRAVGRTLGAGDLISTGSMTRVPPIASGEHWTIETLGGELPALSIDVD